MSDETAPTPDPSPIPSPESAPRVRRISTPRPKKAAKQAEPVVEAEPAPVNIPADLPDHSESSNDHSTENDWPEPEAASTGNPSQAEGAKRKRRRRKGKGQSSAAPQNSISASQEHSLANGEEQSAPAEPQALSEPQASAPRPPVGPPPVKAHQPQPQQPPQRPRVDPELLTKMAWKIYLAEIGEEGVALIGDNDAKELSRRCFRLAEIFAEEQSRRR